MINSLSLPGYQLVDSDEQNEDIHFRLEAPTPVACEGCGVQGEFVRFGKRDVPYRDLPIHGKRVTLWVVRRRYTCRACKTTFRPQLPEMVDGFRMTLRLHEYVEKESFNHPYTFVAAQTGLDEKTVRDIFNARAEFLGRWHRFETPRILGIDELYLNKRYRCILTNIEERTLLDLLATELGPNDTDDDIRADDDGPDDRRPDDGPDDAEVSIPSAAATAAPAKSRLRNAGSMTLVCSDCAAL